MKKHALSFLTMTMALSSGAVFAAAGFGDTSNQSATITFASPSSIAHEVTPSTGLTSGNLAAQTKLAAGTVTLQGDASTQKKVGLTFRNGVKGQSNNYRIIKDKTDANSIVLGFSSSNLNVMGITMEDGLILSNNSPNGTFTYNLVLQGAQTVAAGEYTVEMAAQRWSD